MSTSVIEFELLGERYCFNTQHVAYVFELEEHNSIGGFYEAVIGVTKYNNDLMLLIDTAKLYSDKSLDMAQEKSVIVIYDKDERYYYGMLVDSIIKLEEVEEANPSVDLSTKDLVINHYKDAEEDIIVNEIYPLPLLKKHHIPSMASLHSQSNSLYEVEKQRTNHYLIVRVKEHLYAIASKYVKEVLENEFEMFEIKESIKNIKGAIALRDEIIQVADFEDADKHDIVILEHNGSKVAIEVDEVYDIEDFQADKIEYLNETATNIEAFYNYKEKALAILNPLFYINEKNQSQHHEDAMEPELSDVHQEYLIFYIDNKKYSISMKHVRQVVESETLAKTHSSAIAANEYIEFLATWNHQAVSVIKLDTFLGIQTHLDMAQIIFVEYDKKTVAFLVDDIDNIVYLDNKSVSEIESQKDDIISGAIIYEDEVIVKFNEKFLTGVV